MPPGPGRHSLGFEKPKRASATARRLLIYLGTEWPQLLVIVAALLVSSASSLIGSYFSKPLINDYILPGDMVGLARGLVILAVIYLIGAVAAFAQARLTVHLSQKIIRAVRADLFAALQRLPIAYFDTNTHGELMSRFTNDIDNMQTMLDQSLTQLISSTIIFIGSIAAMIFLSPPLFAVIACVIGIMIFLSAKVGSKSQKSFQNQQKLIGELNGYVEETIGGLKEIKVFGHEAISQTAFNHLNQKYRQTAARSNFLAGMIMPIMGNLNNMSYAIVSMVGSVLALAGRFDLGSLVAFLQYSRQLGQPINQISGQVNNVLAALAGAERVFEVMDQTPEVDTGTATLVKLPQNRWVWRNQQGIDVPLKGDVRFENVTFGYTSKPILKHISLYAKPGQVIAFVGSTGAGKTTITNLINRFYDIQQGSITYDGIPVTHISKASLRQSLGMVLQDTHLFEGNVLDNIRYGNLTATDADCVRAAKMANADSFISRLPQGYQTPISADGVNLSQGQRQLLAIARAYVADPPVMILDEATSSIDTRTERLIEKGLNSLMKGRTVFVIAHRLSTVRHANAILVIENGQIIERGSHDDLLALKGRYYQLYTGKNTLE